MGIFFIKQKGNELCLKKLRSISRGGVRNIERATINNAYRTTKSIVFQSVIFTYRERMGKRNAPGGRKEYVFCTTEKPYVHLLPSGAQSGKQRNKEEIIETIQL